MSMVNRFLKLASPSGTRGRLSVLVFHRVLPGPDPLYPEAMDAARFTEICQWVASMFTVLPLEAAVGQMRAGTLPERALAITFDDGYADNRHVAMPILRSFGLPATVFVTTGFVDGGCMWNDIVIEGFRRTQRPHVDLQDLLPEAGSNSFPLGSTLQRRIALEEVLAAVKYFEVERRLDLVRRIAECLEVKVPTDLMLTSSEVVELRDGGLQVGAHTVTHPILAKLSRDKMHDEMQHSKDFLERLLGERVGMFAYPNGIPGHDYDQRAVALAREVGFDAAVTTARGAASRRSDPFQIPRFTPWDRTPLRFGARMLSTLWTSRRGMPSLAADQPQ